MSEMTPVRLAEKVEKQLGLKTTYIERLFGNKPGSPIFDLMAEDVATLIAALESAWAEVERLKLVLYGVEHCPNCTVCKKRAMAARRTP